jgi:hypothetical protein
MSRIKFSTGSLNSYIIRPDEVQGGDIFAYKTVAVVYGQFWAAYRGDPSWDDEWVATNGDKIDEDIATGLFPTIALGRIYNE